MKKPVRTISGVTPLTIVAKPYPCPHGKCIYCPGNDTIPNSYTSKSPAIMRAKLLDYDPLKQVKARLNAFRAMGHATSKIELIFLGGTFLAYPADYQYSFVKAVYDGLNDSISSTLEEAQKLNETARHRCVAFCIETRPDWAFEKEINRMLEFMVTRVELGVQMPSNKLYKIIHRGHTVKDIVKATRLLKDSGYKVGYHIMPGLPGSSPKKDLKLFKKIFSKSKFRPDQLKLYPCQVIQGTPLARMYYQDLYEPYAEQTTIDLLARMKAMIPPYCRVMRVMRQLAPITLVAGTHKSHLRMLVKQRMKMLGLKCNCIRCREIGFAQEQENEHAGPIKLETIEYKASKGKEFFVQAVNEQDKIFGQIRLRIPYRPFRPEITKNTLLVRELHVYGRQTPVQQTEESVQHVQHKGLGRQLMAKAEEIAAQYKCDDIIVISGVGVRQYYSMLGYERKGPYMWKKVKTATLESAK